MPTPDRDVDSFELAELLPRRGDPTASGDSEQVSGRRDSQDTDLESLHSSPRQRSNTITSAVSFEQLEQVFHTVRDNFAIPTSPLPDPPPELSLTLSPLQISQIMRKDPQVWSSLTLEQARTLGKWSFEQSEGWQDCSERWRQLTSAAAVLSGGWGALAIWQAFSAIQSGSSVPAFTENMTALEKFQIKTRDGTLWDDLDEERCRALGENEFRQAREWEESADRWRKSTKALAIVSALRGAQTAWKRTFGGSQ